MSTKVLTPVGRIVWGNPLVGRDKVKNGQKVLKEGKPVIEYSFGLAIPKDQFGEVGNVMQAEATAAMPQGVPADFAYKSKDGDTGLDGKGQPLNAKPGYAGCYVISISTEFPIAVFKRNGNAFEQLTSGVKTGDFARAELVIQGHGRQTGVVGSKPGLYLNCNMVEFVGYGEEIRGAADPNAAFGQAAALPAGASQTPVASGPAPSAPQANAPQAPPAPNPAFPWAKPS